MEGRPQSGFPDNPRFGVPPRSLAGFTLIELMVVMLLITILLAVAIPRFGSGPFQDPIKKANRWTISTVRSLRGAAIQQHMLQSLVLDLNRHRMWVVHEEMNEEARLQAVEKAFKFPAAIRIVSVQFPGKERVSAGTVEIHFYPSGHSDKAVIHLETDNAERYSWVLEPLLPKVRLHDEWVHH
jgi:prepilin-type N-terminal cleavage/methylation domain-containing protein